MGRRERMKRGSGIQGRGERSRGIGIRVEDGFHRNQTKTPFKLAKLIVVYFQE